MRTIADIVISSNGKRKQVRAVLDTGATVNYIKPEIAKEFPGHMAVVKPFKVGLGGRQHVIKDVVPLTIRIERHEMGVQIFHVAELKKFDAILGALFMEQWGIILDPKRRKIRIRRDWLQLQEEF